MLDTLRTHALALTLAVLSLSCAGPFSKALDRGDRYMEAQMWDRAAESYERAMQLDPSSPEARVRHRRAQGRRAQDRVERARHLIRRGAFEPALELCREAVSFDPNSAEIQGAFNEVLDTAVAEAYQLAVGGQPDRALAMSTTILRIAPGHRGALEIDGRVRGTIASQHDERAQAFLRAGRQGNALVELSLASTVLADPSRASRRLAVLQALRADVRFVVVLASTAAGRDLTSVLRPDALARTLDPRLAIEVTDSPPQGTVRGVRITGSEPAFEFASSRTVAQRACDYVCGTEVRANPAHDVAERAVADTERDLARQEDDVARDEREVDRHQRDLDDVERELTRVEERADRARERLERCLSSGSADRPPSCNSERNDAESAQREVDRARDRLTGPRDRLSAARRQLASAREQRNRARQRRDQAVASMRTTPRTVEVDRMCENLFAVSVHELVGTVRFELHAAPLGSGPEAAMREAIAREARERWETWEAMPRRCPREGKGPPSPAPSEAAMRVRLAADATGEVSKRVMDAFGGALRGWFSVGATAESEGRVDDAVESYVRYLIAGAGTGEPEALRAAGGCLRRARGMRDPVKELLEP